MDLAQSSMDRLHSTGYYDSGEECWTCAHLNCALRSVTTPTTPSRQRGLRDPLGLPTCGSKG